MNPDRWQKIDGLFQSALALGGSERALFLEQECGRDLELRNQIEQLLLAHDEAGSFIEEPAVERAALSIASENAKSGSPLIGASISHYQIVSRLGEGGMGVVYLAHDTQLARKVALKVLPDYLTRDPDRLRRFEQEARCASVLNHPNIITVHEIGHAESLHFIATEYIEGITLREYFENKRLELSEVLDIAMQVAAALIAAHAKGIVHRDIKPENIMVSKENPLLDREHYVKVLDFGIAKLTEVSKVDTELPTRPMANTGVGLTMGTAPYMSPEQAQGLPVDVRTDIWSLGVVIYEMLTGQLPFKGPTVSHVIVSILEKEPPPFRTDFSVPTTLATVVMRMLSKDRDERQQTARELLDKLKTIKVHEHFETGKSSPTKVFESPIPIDDQVKTVNEQARSEGVRSHSRGVAVALAVLVIGVISVFGFYMFRNRPARNTNAFFCNVKVIRHSTSGQARFASISPDGKYAVHVTGPVGQQSLYLRHIATGSDTEIVATNGDPLLDSTFSPDGNDIYFTRVEATGLRVLYQVPLLGSRSGQPRRVLSDVDTKISFSPDGTRFTFLRGDVSKSEAYLIVVNADGTNEQKLATHPMRDLMPNDAAGPCWSPDGNSIAFALADPDSGHRFVGLMVWQLKDGVARRIATHNWYSIQAIGWLREGRGLIFTADEQDGGLSKQLWFASFPDGVVRKITNDPINYRNVSLTADSRTLLTIQTERLCDIWVASDQDSSRARQVTSNRSEAPGRISWTPEGRVVHVSKVSGNFDVWIMNADGSTNTQLTRNAGSNLRPTVSFDGRYIVFESSRSGESNIWRMDIDGSNQTQLTHGDHDTSPLFALDNRTVIYTSTRDAKRSLWKVTIEGGTPVQLIEYSASGSAISPQDGTIVGVGSDERVTPKVSGTMLISANGGSPITSFQLPQMFFQLPGWTANGNAITYIAVADGASNIWAQPLDKSPRKQLTHFSSSPDLILGYGWSRDGKQLAVARGTQTSDIVSLTDLGEAK